MDNMRTTINLPPIIFGTSGLGNLYVDMDEEAKCEIIKEYVRLSNGPVVFDSAGKYGAGLALEVIGNCLRRLNVSAEDVIISNKLGWLQLIKTAEPTFEPGVWKNLKHDAVQKISTTVSWNVLFKVMHCLMDTLHKCYLYMIPMNTFYCKRMQSTKRIVPGYIRWLQGFIRLKKAR